MIAVKDKEGNVICVADTVDEAFDLIRRFDEEDGVQNEYTVHKT